MEALILSIPAWITDAMFTASIYLLLVAMLAVTARAVAEYQAPVIEDEWADVPEVEQLTGGMTQAEFDQAYGVQR